MPSSILLWSTPARTPIWPNESSERMNGCSMMMSVDASSTACTNRGSSPFSLPSRTARSVGVMAARDLGIAFRF